MLPGWYGMGTAFEEFITRGMGPGVRGRRGPVGWGPGRWGDGARLKTLQDLYQKWPFFRTVLSNMAQVIAKADMGLARAMPIWSPTNPCVHVFSGKIVESTIGPSRCTS